MPTDVAAPSSVHRTVGGLPMITWPALERPDVDAYVTTRAGGVSRGRFASLNLGPHVGDRAEDVLANRATVAAALDTTLDDVVFCEQVHGSAVTVVTDADRGRGTRTAALAATDAMVTTVPGIVLAVMVADCVPLVLFDPRAKVLACVHAGWGGTVRGVTPAAVAAMTMLGSDPADVIAGIGPSVHPDHYQVGADVAEQARATFGDRTDQVIRPDGTGRWLFDLWTASRLQLAAAGVPARQIHLAGLATGPGTAFFSHRFEGPCGRFVAVARMRAAR